MWDLRPERSEQFARAIADARAGRSRVVCIDGVSGMGKSSHLQRMLAEASGFRVIQAFGDPAAYRPPFGVLQQLGVGRTTADDGTPLTPAVAAQALRRLIDEQGGQEALALAIDDAQWADEESMQALRLVLERVSGDRLLVVVASRPLTGPDHLAWRRFRDRPGAAMILALDGIELSEAFELIRAADPGGADERTAERLWRHTDGNPMYLKSLLAQYTVSDLRGTAELPAPVEVARDLDARLTALDAEAARLLRAVAVVGSSWVDRLDAAAIADIDDATAAAELLLSGGLLVARAGGGLTDVRIVHALMRAAIYQCMPADERRIRHRRAAEVLASPMRRLEHEVAAAGRRDDALADRLEAAADAASSKADHRREAQLLQWASQLSETVAKRERRWLDAQLATVLARDVAAVRDRVSEIAWAGDIPRRTVVLAMLFVAENRLAEARRLLEAVTGDDLADADPTVRVRLQVLGAWTMLVSGYATDRVKEALRRVPEGAGQDPVTGSFYVRTVGQIAGREDDFTHLARDFAAIPLHARDTSMPDTGRLSWRGAMYAMCGFAAEGRRDLAEVVARIREGRVEATGGVDQALYGFALWQDGELDRANIEFDAAAGLALDRVQPLVQATLPLIPAVRGDFTRADRLLTESEVVLRDLPWREAINVLLQARIVRLHAGGDASTQAGFLTRADAIFGAAATSPANPAGAIWQLHLALARTWAGQTERAREHLTTLAADMIVPEWAVWAEPWVRGLIAERSGNPGASRQLLHDAVAACNDELPLYRAHLHADLARLSRHEGRTDAAVRAIGNARTLYARLGAAPYLARIAMQIPEPPGQPATGIFQQLSDREREVAALLVAGLSYAQIAAELYVTRSTVGYHLGNIYAKTGVSSRHALTQLART